MKTIGVFVLSILFMTSCGTFNNRYHYHGDAKNSDTANVALLAYESDIKLKAINGERVNYSLTTGDKVVYLNAGIYTFRISYSHYYSGINKRSYVNDVEFGPHILEGGKHYILSAFPVTGNLVRFTVHESQKPVDTGKKFSLAL